MDAGVERLSDEDEHAYALALEGRPVAHVWWDADPRRREAVGWYVRDLRTPGRVRRLDLGADAVDGLAGDAEAESRLWLRNALAAAAASRDRALERANEIVLEGPGERYEIQVTGLDAATLAAALPQLTHGSRDERHVLTGRLTPLELGAALAAVRKLGGTTIAVVRLD